MNLIECPNHHYYDADRFPTCPYCNDVSNSGFSQTVPADPQLSDRLSRAMTNLKFLLRQLLQRKTQHLTQIFKKPLDILKKISV